MHAAKALARLPRTAFQSGHVPWNKDIPMTEEAKRKSSDANKGQHFSRSTEFKKGKMSSFKGKHHSEQTKVFLSRKSKELWNDPIYRKRTSSAHLGRKQTEKQKRKVSERMTGNQYALGHHHPLSEKHKKQISKALKVLHADGKTIGMHGKRHSEAAKKKISEAHRGMHPNEATIKKWLTSCSIKPNKAELRLNEFLQKIAPNEYSLNVSGGILILGGKVPDFVNINGQKNVIELWGDFWHRGQNPEDRVNYFREFGWNCLIIWEHELKRPEALKEKIIGFVGGIR